MSKGLTKVEAKEVDELVEDFLKGIGFKERPDSPLDDSKVEVEASKRKGLFTDEEIDSFCTPREKNNKP